MPPVTAQRVEDDLSYQRAGRALGEAFDRLPAWEERIESLTVQAESSLAADDAATAYDPLSTQIRGQLAHALDHLMTLEALIRQAEVLPAMAAFTLLRSSLESVGVALWMLGPSSRDERVLRTLRTDYEALVDVYGVKEEITGNSTVIQRLPADHTTKLRLEELRDGRPALVGRALHVMPSITKRLREADQYVASRGAIQLVALWRTLSGVAHGRRHVLANLLDREVIGVDEKMYSMRMTSSLSLFTGSYYIAEQYLSQLVKLFLMRADRASTLSLSRQHVISGFHRSQATTTS